MVVSSPARGRFLLAFAMLPLTSCAGGGGATPATAAGHLPAGALTVFAAASLSAAFTAAEPQLERSNPGFSPRYSFAGSQQLVTEVVDGAPADVIATADTDTMQRLVAAGLVRSPRTFAHNSLEIVVAPGNPKHVRGLADLARADLAVVLADPSVPAGHFAAQVLARAGVTVKARSLELDVEAVLEKVESGDADAGIAYRTDARAAAGRVGGVPIPAGANVIATYPIAVLAGSRRPTAAAAFVQDALSGDVHAALVARGFLPP
ncbi:MAG: molybdate ABC transporter substrate-binding protein [Candidatus Dormibacteria bacterium]